jgi:hypothetical protein
VTSHEENLLAVLEKIGQPEGVSAAVPAVEDADAPLGEHLEALPGPSEDPNAEPQEPRPGIPEGPVPITNKNLFVHHDTHPVVFDIILLKQYQEDWFTWEAETLWKEIKEDFRVPSISDHSKAKIQAIKTLHINEWFWTKWEVFCWITQAVNNNIPDFQVLQKPSIPQLFNAVDIAGMVRKDEKFLPEIQMFVAAAIVDEGVVYAPEPVAFCQDEIVQLLGDQKIDGAEQLISSVKKRFEQIMKIDPADWAAAKDPILQEVPEDIQSAKLKVAADYLSLRRSQLQHQLRLLR